MELKRYLLPLRRWWWLLLAATVVAGLSSFLATLRQPPIYQALTTLMVGQVFTDPNPSTTEFNLSQQLATNYAEIANREPMREATMQALGLTVLPDYQATAQEEGQFIEIVVTDIIPERAQAVANELANQLVLRTPTGGGSQQQSRQEFITKQLDKLQVQIDATEQEIVRLQEELGGMDSARQISDTQFQITALEMKLSDLQTNYADLLANTQSGALNTISIIETASVPTKPIGPNKALTILLSAAIGFSLAGAAAYILDYLDDTVKTAEEVEALTHASIIGYIAELDGDNVGRLYVSENPRHPVVEAYRSLRTNLEFAGVDNPLKTLLVTSADTEDGKTSVAANLAAVMAQAENKVILVDSDLRKPNVHNFFGMSNDYGLSDVFRGRLSIEDATKEWSGGKVKVITAGAPPPNPAELLGSKKMIQILEYLESQADVVIIDGPPFVVADAAVLSAKVDGVLLVIRANHTHQPAIRAMMEQVSRAGARVVGVALNRIPRKSAGYYSGHYYSSYYSKGSGDQKDTGKASSSRRTFPFGGDKAKDEYPPTTKRAKLAETDAASGKGD
jgi:non-specific protein-tyrosine kinase